MNRNHKKAVSLVLSLLLMVGILTGCSSNSSNVATDSPIPVATSIPTVNPDTIENTPVPEAEVPEEEKKAEAATGLNAGQLKAINTLNYLTSLLQDIHDSKQNRIYLQEAFVSLKDNTHPDIDSITQSYISDMLNTLSNLRMLAVKRDHLEYIYEQ